MTKDEALYLTMSALLGAAASFIRTLYEGRPLAFWRRLLIVFIGALVGTGAGAVAIGLGLHPFIAVAAAAIIGSAGEMLLAGIWQVGHDFQRNPVKTAGEVAEVVRGSNDGGPA